MHKTPQSEYGKRIPAHSGGKSLVLRVTNCQPWMRALAQIMASGNFSLWLRRKFRLSSKVASSSSMRLKLASIACRVAPSRPGGALTCASTQVMGLM